MDNLEDLDYFRQHAMIVTGMTGSAADRQFIVRDSRVPHETRYTIEEIWLMMGYFFTVEPADNQSAEAILKFAAEKPAGKPRPRLP